jgi:hypothetical protein
LNRVPTETAEPWWRQQWVRWAGAIAVAQVVAIWAVSPRSKPIEPPTPKSRQTFQDTVAGAGDFETLKRMLTPSLMPSWNDFSGSAWLARQPAEVTFEPLAVENRPLPPVTLALLPMDWPTRDARLHGLAWQWLVPSHQPGIPKAPPLPVSRHGSVRIAEGLVGWRLPAELSVPQPPSGASPRPVVLRIRVDGRGRVAGPPILWNDSGVLEADQRALRFVADLAFAPTTSTLEDEDVDPADWRSGLLVLEWSVPAKAAADAAAPEKT